MLGLEVPLIGLAVVGLALAMRSWKSLETAIAMNSLNWICTFAQMASGQMMIVWLFVLACVVGVFYLLWSGPRKTEYAIMVLLALNVINYGAYFITGAMDSIPFRVNGNWVILAIYFLCAVGAVHECIFRPSHADVSGDRLYRPSVGLKGWLARRKKAKTRE